MSLEFVEISELRVDILPDESVAPGETSHDEHPLVARVLRAHGSQTLGIPDHDSACRTCLRRGELGGIRPPLPQGDAGKKGPELVGEAFTGRAKRHL